MLRKENLAAFHAAEQCDGVFPLCERGRKQTEEFRLHVGEDAVDHANALGISGRRLQEQRTTAPLFDTGLNDVFQVIYPFGTLPWGHPSLWDGKIAEDWSYSDTVGLLRQLGLLRSAMLGVRWIARSRRAARG